MWKEGKMIGLSSSRWLVQLRVPVTLQFAVNFSSNWSIWTVKSIMDDLKETLHNFKYLQCSIQDVNQLSVVVCHSSHFTVCNTFLVKMCL